LSFPSKNNLVTGIRNSGGGGGGGEQSNMVAHYTMDNVDGGVSYSVDPSENITMSMDIVGMTRTAGREDITMSMDIAGMTRTAGREDITMSMDILSVSII